MISLNCSILSFQSKVKALRQNHPGMYQNVACIRTNAMKYLPNYFKKVSSKLNVGLFNALKRETALNYCHL